MGDEARDPKDPPSTHRLVEALRREDDGAEDWPLTLTGLFEQGGESGRHRVYFSPQHYAEFDHEDALRYDQVPGDPVGFPGEEATQVTLKRGAKVTHVRTNSVTADNQFDLDMQLGGGPGGGATPMLATLGCPGSVRTMCAPGPPPGWAYVTVWCTTDPLRTMFTWNCNNTWAC